MNSEAEIPDMNEVRRVLKEADVYDETLNRQEMLQLYQVVVDSQTTATQEDEHRKIFEQTEVNCSTIEELQTNTSADIEEPCENSVEEAIEASEELVCSSSSKEDAKIETKEKSFTPKTWFYKKKQEKQDLDDQVSSTSTPLKDMKEKAIEEEEEDINVADDVVDVFNSVPTAHKPLTLIHRICQYSPPPYCNPKFAHLGVRERARVIANYHSELLAKQNAYYRQSVVPAPWGKPIQTSIYFNGNLMKSRGKGEETMESCGNEQETTENSDQDFQIYVSKSGRQTKRKHYTETGNNNDGEWKTKPSLNDEYGKKTSAKKQRTDPQSNEAIMKRSKLFADKSNSRTERLFDKLKEQDNKRNENGKRTEKLRKSLDSDSDEEFMGNSTNVADLIHSEEPFIKRRIQPPSRQRKGKVCELSKSRKTSGNKKSENSSQESLSQKYDPLEYAKPVGRLQKKASCPVCYQEFFQSELEEHAAACLDTINENSSPRDVNFEKISCEKCDQVFPLNFDYEEHVKDCLKNRM